MVSDESKKLFFRVFNVGSQLGVYPAVWNSETAQITLVTGKRIYFPWNRLKFLDTSRIFPIIYFLFQLFYFLYFILFLIFGEYTILDICLSSFLIVTFYFGLLTQLIGVVLNLNRFCDLWSSFLVLDFEFSKLAN